MQQNRRGGSSWIGWLIFIVLVFGSRLLPPVAGWLTQVTGVPISTSMLVAGLVGLGIVVSVVSSVARQVGQLRRTSETRLPTGQTTLPPPLSPPSPRPQPPPTAAPRLPPGPTSQGGRLSGLPPSITSGEQRLPGPPRFEPIIDPRILSFGIVGLLILGAFFLVALIIVGA